MPTRKKGRGQFKIDRMYTAQVIPKRIGMGLFDKLVGMVGAAAGLASKNQAMMNRASRDFDKGVGKGQTESRLKGKRKGGFSFHVPFFGSGKKKRKSRKKA